MAPRAAWRQSWVVPALHHSSGPCSASRRQKVDRQLGGDQPIGARLERIVDVVAAPFLVSPRGCALVAGPLRDPGLSLPSLAQDDCLDDATVRFFLERNLVARAQGDGGDVSEALVASLSPSIVPMSEVSWPEARWSWYLAHLTGPPDLCQFSGSVTRDSSLTAGVSNSVFGSSSSSHGVSSSSPRAAEFPTTRASSKRSKPLPSCVQSAGFDAVSPVVSPWMPMPREDLCTFAHTLRASPWCWFSRC